LLQFGHGSEAVETCCDPTYDQAVNGLQFGHGSEAVETTRSSALFGPERFSFNSATAVKPWKPGGAYPGAVQKYCFNSATAVKPWKRKQGQAKKKQGRVLQFGHGSEAVETSVKIEFRQLSEIASIRPRQ